MIKEFEKEFQRWKEAKLILILQEKVKKKKEKNQVSTDFISIDIVPEQLSTKTSFDGIRVFPAVSSRMPPSRRRCRPLHRGSSAKLNVPWPLRSDKSFAVDGDRHGIARICEIVSPYRLQWKGTSSFVIPIIRLDRNTSSRWKKIRLEFYLTVYHIIGAIENFRSLSRN